MSKITLLIVGLGLLTQRAEATYIDPGSGQFLLQLLGVAFFGSLFYVKRVWVWFLGLFSKKKKSTALNESSKKKAA